MKDVEISAKDLERAAAFREDIHREALSIVRAAHPEITSVVDPNPAEAYISKVWDYPGAWYVMISVPEGYKSRSQLIDTIVRNTIEKPG